jgi:hypothetical protein
MQVDGAAALAMESIKCADCCFSKGGESATGSGSLSARSLPLKDVANRALQPVTNLLQGLEGDILLSNLQPLQGRVADPDLPGELLIREVAPPLPQECTELFCQPLSHLTGILI